VTVLQQQTGSWQVAKNAVGAMLYCLWHFVKCLVIPLVSWTLGVYGKAGREILSPVDTWFREF